jgi:hypothetical protein
LYLPAAALVAIVLAVLVAARWQLPGSQPSQTAVSESGPRISQVQFSTPGGTRIVWAFNPNLKF